MRTSKRFPVIILIVGTFLLQSCGGGGSTSTTVPASTPTPVPIPQISSFELIDPAPGSPDKFGNQVAILPNGNIIVSDPGDFS
jgi:hypothetical protein